jgi:arylsulfatase A-like enzyme
MNHWNPILYENRNLVPASSDPDYHLTTDLADKAISWVRQSKAIAPDRPYFLYVATGATHAPHHTPQEWIAKFKGQFDEGWDTYREQTLERQKKLGIVPQDTKLTVRSKGLPAWDSLNADQKRLYARMMEVFAGYAAHCDHELGRVVEACKQLPDGDNTLIVYIAGDNGASAEGGLEGSLCENMFFNGFAEKWQDNIKAIDDLGGPKHFNHFPSSWAHAMNAPFQWTKQVASHFGGTRNPMIVSWPERIKDKGGLRDQFLHTIDIVPTIYEVCGVHPPAMLNAFSRSRSRESVSRTPSLTAKPRDDARRSISSLAAIAASITTAGWRRRRRSFRGIRTDRNGTPTRPCGSFTESTKISPRPRTLPPSIRRSYASFRISGGSRPRNTTCFLSTGAARSA